MSFRALGIFLACACAAGALACSHRSAERTGGPVVLVTADQLGLDAEKIEPIIAVPVQRALAMAQLPHLAEMRASMTAGHVDVLLGFDAGEDADAALAAVTSAVRGRPMTGGLPDGVLLRARLLRDMPVVRLAVHGGAPLQATVWAKGLMRQLDQIDGLDASMCGEQVPSSKLVLDLGLYVNGGAGSATLDDVMTAFDRSELDLPAATPELAAAAKAIVKREPVTLGFAGCRAADLASPAAIAIAIRPWPGAPGVAAGVALVRAVALVEGTRPPASTGIAVEWLPATGAVELAVDADTDQRLASVQATLAKLRAVATLAIEQGGVDDRGVRRDPSAIAVRMTPAPGTTAAELDAAARKALGGLTVRGAGATIVRIVGPDRKAIDRVVSEIAIKLHGVQRPIASPHVSIDVNEDAAQKLGVDAAALARTIGALVGEHRSPRGDPVELSALASQAMLPVWLPGADGAHVTLLQVASFHADLAPSLQLDIAQFPAVELRVTDTPDAARAALAKIPLPRDLRVIVDPPAFP